jgi:hypothetical protein
MKTNWQPGWPTDEIGAMGGSLHGMIEQAEEEGKLKPGGLHSIPFRARAIH